MDIIYIIKTLLIGCLGAGGFYFITSFILHYFPLPLYIKTKSIIDAWAFSRVKTKGDFADKLWKATEVFFKILMVLTWWAIFGVYAFLLQQTLHYYLPIQGNLFWGYYALAIIFPSIWAIVTCWRFFNPKEKKEAIFVIEDDSDKTLIQRMAGES